MLSRIGAHWQAYAAVAAIAWGLATLQATTEEQGETITTLEKVIEERKTQLALLQGRVRAEAEGLERSRAAHAPDRNDDPAPAE